MNTITPVTGSDILRKNFRKVIVVAVIIVVLAASYGGYWYFAAMQAVGFLEKLDSGADSSFQIAYGDQSTTGFPFAIKLHLPEFEIITADQRIRWRSEKAILEIQPWNVRRYRLALFGSHLIDLEFQNKTLRYSIISKRADLVSELSRNGWPSQGAINLGEVSVSHNGGQQVFFLSRLEILVSVTGHSRMTYSEPSLELSVSADSLILSSLENQPLGNQIQKFGTGLKVLGPIDQYDKIGINEWRQDGGTIEVSWFKTVWGSLDLRAAGTITLDDQLRPLAAMTTEIRGYVEALNALEEKNIIPRSVARTGQIALNMLATPSVDGTPPVLSLPLTAQDGAVYLGPLRLAQVPSLFY